MRTEWDYESQTYGPDADGVAEIDEIEAAYLESLADERPALDLTPLPVLDDDGDYPF